VAAAGAAPLVAWYVVKLATTPVAVGAGASDVRLGDNLPELPVWSAKFLASASGAVFGLPPAGGAVVLGTVVVAGALALAVGTGRLASSLTPRALGLLVTLGATVLATGAARAASTPPTTSRYLYFPAIVLVLLGCELWPALPRVRVPARLVAPVGVAVVAVAVGLGANELRDGKVFYRRAADGTAARMGALRLLGDRVPPGFAVVEPSRLAYTRAEVDRFVRRFGDRPVDGRAELGEALPESRAAVDGLLAAALVRPAAGAAGPCAPLRRETLGPGSAYVVVRARRPALARLRAFAEPPGAVAVPVGAGKPVVLRVDDPALGRPWRIVAPATSLRVCTPGIPPRRDG
jgi:hypothetical protein